MKTGLSWQQKETQSLWAFSHLPPLWMSETGTQLLVDAPPHSGPGKFDRPVTHGLMKVGSKTSHGWEDHKKISGVGAFRGCPVTELKLYAARADPS